jgi:phosphoribosylformimino-5-aminoimidazole carboxamide ribotide isomerase
MSILDVAKQVEQMGIQEIVYTDVLCDGTLKGPNFQSILELAKGVNLKLIVSGGFSKLSDIKRLRGIEGVVGVILGKALYTGKIKLEEAISILQN